MGTFSVWIFRFLPRLVKYLSWPRREMWVLMMNAASDVITDWRILSPSDLLLLDYYQYEDWISTFPTHAPSHDLLKTNQKFLRTGTNWGIPNKKLTCVLLSCLSGLLVNVKCVLLNHLFVIWQQHFSCYHKRLEIKLCWKFLYRAALTRTPGFIDNLYTGVGTPTSQLCSQKKVINYWLKPSRQFPRADITGQYI